MATESKLLALLAAGSLAGLTWGCGDPEPNRAEITISGDAANYQAPICVEVTWHDDVDLVYSVNACSTDSVAAKFSTKIVAEPRRPDTEVYDHVGSVYLKFGSDEIKGTINDKQEELTDEAAIVTLSVKFAAP